MVDGCYDIEWQTAVDLGDEARRFRPMPGKILVLPDPPKTTTSGGLHLPDTSIKRAQTGTIVALGDGCHPDLHVGQTVFIAYWAAWAIELDSRDYRIYLEKDLGGFLAPPG